MTPPVLDALARALRDVFRPGIIGLTLLPLLAAVVFAWVLGWFWWQDAVKLVRAALFAVPLPSLMADWLSISPDSAFAGWLAALAVILLATPLIVLVSLAVASMLLTPMLTRWVARRRFPWLARAQGASLPASIGWSAGSLGLAVLAVIVTLPLWLVPPVGFLLPPFIWGWLTYRVMSFDALSEYASADERRHILRAQRWPLLAIGVLCGCLGAAPSVVWASSVLFVALFAVLVPLAIWIYTLVFVFSSLWFAHYGLAALVKARREPAFAAVNVPAASPDSSPAAG